MSVSLTLLVVILSVCVRNLWILLTQGSSSSLLVDNLFGHVQTNNLSDYTASVKIIGSNYEPEESMEITLTSGAVKYIMIVPHGLDSKQGVDGLSVPSDREAVPKLTVFLDKHPEFDGANGVTSQLQIKGPDETKKSLEQSACRFQLKNLTLIIRTSGKIHKLQGAKQDEEYQECNITENAFLIRKEHFLELRWRSDYGSLGYLDFFLRSKEH